MKNLLLFSSILLCTTAASAGSVRDFAGSYLPVGTCSMIDGNRSMNKLEIKAAPVLSILPAGSQYATFSETSHPLADFTVYLIDGNGTVFDPDSGFWNNKTFQYANKMTFETETTSSELSTTIVHHERFEDRKEVFKLTPSPIGGPILNLEYTTGNYAKLDNCTFVKVK